MGVKTLVLLALVFGVFCIGLSQGKDYIDCYECTMEKDGAGCAKPEKSFLSICYPDIDLEKRTRLGCGEVYIKKTGGKSLERRICVRVGKLVTDVGCHDWDQEPGKEICTCFEDGCNNRPEPVAAPSGPPGGATIVGASLARVIGATTLLLLH